MKKIKVTVFGHEGILKVSDTGGDYVVSKIGGVRLKAYSAHAGGFRVYVAGAVAIARGIDRIVIGCNADDASDFPDCRGEFVGSMQQTLRAASGRDIEIVAPWLYLTKAEALRMFARTNEGMALIRRSVSCYEGSVPGCGACSACVKRAAAFAGASISEAT